MFVKNERFTQRDTIVDKDGKIVAIQPCSRFFSINVCYRCCNGKLEIRLSSIVPCDSNKYLPEKDWTRGCKWRYDTWFWKQVDDAIMYSMATSIPCDNVPLNCSTLPECGKEEPRKVLTYYKANCMQYRLSVSLTGSDTYVMVPCDGSGECKQEWAVCCLKFKRFDGTPDSKVQYSRVQATTTGGCYRSLGGGVDPECLPTCW